MDQLCRIPAMTIQDPTVTRAELAIEEAELIDGGPAVSWGVIIAGALSAAALSFVLLAIGAAFGLSVTSPWDFTGRDAGEAAAAGESGPRSSSSLCMPSRRASAATWPGGC